METPKQVADKYMSLLEEMCRASPDSIKFIGTMMYLNLHNTRQRLGANQREWRQFGEEVLQALKQFREMAADEAKTSATGGHGSMDDFNKLLDVIRMGSDIAKIKTIDKLPTIYEARYRFKAKGKAKRSSKGKAKRSSRR